MSKSNRRLRRAHLLECLPQRFLMFPLALKDASHSLDPFLTKHYYSGWKAHPAVFNSTTGSDSQQAVTFGPLYQLELGFAKTTSNSSMTVVLPLSEDSARTLEATIFDLLEYTSTIKEVVILCPEMLLSMARSSLRRFLSLNSHIASTQLTLLPCPHATCSTNAFIVAAFHASTDWTLILEESGLQEVNKAARSLLLNPPTVTFPLGLKGFALPRFEDQKETCLTPLVLHRSADFLVPPFVLPSFVFSNEPAFPARNLDSWSALGHWISKKRPDMIGGIIVNQDLAGDSCVVTYSEVQDPVDGQRISTLPMSDHHSNAFGLELPFSNTSAHKSYGHFGVVLPALGDLTAFSQAACALVANGHPHANPALISTDTSQLFGPPDIFITLTTEDVFTSSLTRAARAPHLIYADWMGALSLTEWRNWNLPRIDVSIITNNRPQSLLRLLCSLQNARYFGDTLNLRLNMEDSADPATKQLVEDIEWRHGHASIHHRISHGGLLTAVVESWYPRSNDSYGLLLEDDVEVSPLFYAWIKLAFFATGRNPPSLTLFSCDDRFRYGETNNMSPRLFGISLYQQKNLELRIEGRRPFNARWLFKTTGIAAQNTPYLSQIPCSWGALYFPEHWREFHTYVANRLTDPSLSLKENIVPDVRSSRWQNSWKKYFIEMVFLRGYTMLYPNYANFSSLSTNHLEPGAHVKRLPRAVFDKKRAQFDLPLMRLPDANASESLTTGLLDLPKREMPTWDALPVLDLHGFVVSEE
ncbi:hypothetical protein B0F90DRAFT_1693909 [Multifurca ochricompacta]|uniref:Uncharacterized protein n=1 Tax=Multifurca ochricompacta TaxID=376703 RepID=A0AAD4MA45_9AGAM|nr:hypothetical protein B0F90DRAFT_1693909 [Multifurca ochricompacta]